MNVFFSNVILICLIAVLSNAGKYLLLSPTVNHSE